MIRSNKFLIFSVITGLIVASSLLLLYRTITTNSLIEQEKRASINFAYLLSNTLFPQFEGFLNNIDSLDGMGLRSVQETYRLNNYVHRNVLNTNILKVKIYNQVGRVLYSSESAQIGDLIEDGQSFDSAIKGMPISVSSFREVYQSSYGLANDRYIVVTYIPITQVDPVSTFQPIATNQSREVIGVFEINSDVTELVNASNITQMKVGLAVIVSMFIVYTALFMTARRADKILHAQQNERRASEEQIRYQAYHDSLTRLPNRTSFIERLDETISRAKRDQAMAGVMFLDIDRFKLINDSLGHHAGDELLCIAAKRLHSVIRESDLLFRMGGDEFTVIPGNIDFPDGVAHLAERMLEVMKKPVELDGHSIVVTASIGISVYPKDDTDPVKLVKNADAAMYLSKEGGRNQYSFYTPEMNSRASDRLAIESDLQQALGRNEFVLHYQPRVASENGELVGMEALLRWQRPGKGLVPPGDFIHILEDHDLIVDVGEWVLRTAAMRIKEWLASGLDPKRVSVNVSSRQFRRGDFVELVKSVIDDVGISPHYLELELTESLLLDNASRAIEIMNQLKDIGVILSIDDFGTGYSSLNYLKLLPIDFLKIDRSFINDVTTNDKDVAIVNTITTLASELRIGVVAEGVETRDQWELLKTKDCHELQGYYFSRPVEVEEIGKMLTQKNFASNQQAS